MDEVLHSRRAFLWKCRKKCRTEKLISILNGKLEKTQQQNSNQDVLVYVQFIFLSSNGATGANKID